MIVVPRGLVAVLPRLGPYLRRESSHRAADTGIYTAVVSDTVLSCIRTGMVSSLRPPHSPSERLETIASHLRQPAMSNKLKVVVTRDLGPDVMPLLLDNKELDVSDSHH